MGTRGRKSHADLTVAPVTELKPLPKPPAHLTPKQGEIWRMVVASRAGEFISPEAYPVLVEYCRAVELADEIAAELSSFDPEWRKPAEGLKRWKLLQQMSKDQAQIIASLSVKLRLSPSTRVHPEKVGRASMKGAKRMPWDFDPNET